MGICLCFKLIRMNRCWTVWWGTGLKNLNVGISQFLDRDIHSRVKGKKDFSPCFPVLALEFFCVAFCFNDFTPIGTDTREIILPVSGLVGPYSLFGSFLGTRGTKLPQSEHTAPFLFFLFLPLPLPYWYHSQGSRAKGKFRRTHLSLDVSFSDGTSVHPHNEIQAFWWHLLYHHKIAVIGQKHVALQ